VRLGNRRVHNQLQCNAGIFLLWMPRKMSKSNSVPQISLPNSWPGCVRTGMLHVISLAKYAIVHTRSWAADSRNARVRLKAENDRLRQDNALLREEM
jgi:hypothetical protein